MLSLFYSMAPLCNKEVMPFVMCKTLIEKNELILGRKMFTFCIHFCTL